LILLGSGAGAGRSSVQFDRLEWSEPGWLRNPALFEGIFVRRCVAYFLDAVLTVILAALVGFAACTLSITTLGLLGIPAFLLAAPFIHFVLAAATIGGRRAATPGMRAMGLRVVAWTGENPGGLRGILQPAMFYMTVPTTAMVILLFACFDPRGRCLHDHLAGVLVVRSEFLPAH
jgi:uncharacterized RDD family membrane protein YckC